MVGEQPAVAGMENPYAGKLTRRIIGKILRDWCPCRASKVKGVDGGWALPNPFSFVVLVVEFTRESNEDFEGFITVGNRNYSTSAVVLSHHF